MNTAVTPKEIQSTIQQLLAMGWKQFGKEYFKRLDRKNGETKKILQKTGDIKL